MKTILLITMIALTGSSWSQTESKEQLDIRATIDLLFEGMRLGDSTIVRSVFHEDARAFTSFKKDDAFQLLQGSINEFVMAVGSPHAEIWDERISNVVIQVDDGIAQVWMDYSFYLGDAFLHEGVNAMQFVHVDERWQILQIADTRKK